MMSSEDDSWVRERLEHRLAKVRAPLVSSGGIGSLVPSEEAGGPTKVLRGLEMTAFCGGGSPRDPLGPHGLLHDSQNPEELL